MLLSILAFSGDFRDAATFLKEREWALLGRMIAVNRDSLELFAKVRGLDWQAPLQYESRVISLLDPNTVKECFPYVQRTIRTIGLFKS